MLNKHAIKNWGLSRSTIFTLKHIKATLLSIGLSWGTVSPAGEQLELGNWLLQLRCCHRRAPLIPSRQNVVVQKGLTGEVVGRVSIEPNQPLVPQLRDKLHLDTSTKLCVGSTIIGPMDTFNGLRMNDGARITLILSPIEWFYQRSGLQSCINEGARTYQQIAQRIHVRPFGALQTLDSLTVLQSLRPACTSTDKATLEASIQEWIVNLKRTNPDNFEKIAFDLQVAYFVTNIV